jgi:hypothetical protein
MNNQIGTTPNAMPPTESHPRLYSWDEVQQKLRMMRQWLNEDRIDDPKKMVSTEDLMVWFKIKNLGGDSLKATSELLENDKLAVESMEERVDKKFDNIQDSWGVNCIGYGVTKTIIKHFIRKELALQKKQILAILVDEIAIAHTHNQPTMRITSAYNRIRNLK